MSNTRYYRDLIQGTDEWLDMRQGMITASTVGKLVTPTLKVAKNATSRSHIYDLAAQRITNRREDNFCSYDMERGNREEIIARDIYIDKFAPVDECGFITNDQFGFDFGFSPDGLVGDDGMIEIKSRLAKLQVKTLIENYPETIPSEYMMQIQTGLLVTGREWCDFVSYSNGFCMVVIRVYPDVKIMDTIADAIVYAEAAIKDAMHQITGAFGKHVFPVEWVENNDEEITV